MVNATVANKDKNVEKVNTLGKVSRIMLNIALTALIIGMVTCIVMSIYFCTLSKDAVALKGDFKGSVTVSHELPEKFIVINEEDVEVGKEGRQLKYSVTENRDEDNNKVYDISFLLDKLTGTELKLVAAGAMALIALSLLILSIIVIFGKKLAKALETCDSPFEDNVLKKMKSFGFSLIPWALYKLIVGNLGGITTVIFVLIVLLFISVFNYGAKLQTESDETL